MLGQVSRAHFLAGAAAVAIALLAASPAPAEIYKWTDEDGSVVYSEKPPAGTEAEEIKPLATKPPTAAPAPVVRRPRSIGYKEPELTPEQLARKQQNCENAKSQLAEMNSPRANRLQYVKEDGERAFLTEEQRNDRSAEAQAAVDEFCN